MKTLATSEMSILETVLCMNWLGAKLNLMSKWGKWEFLMYRQIESYMYWSYTKQQEQWQSFRWDLNILEDEEELM